MASAISAMSAMHAMGGKGMHSPQPQGQAEDEYLTFVYYMYVKLHNCIINTYIYITDINVHILNLNR